MHRHGIRLRDFQPGETPVFWFVVFCKGKNVHWWDRWLKPGWSHCWALRWDGFNWIYVNPITNYWQVGVSPLCEYTWRDQAIGESTAVMGVTAIIRNERLRSRFFMGPVTCVEVIKALLGIRAFFVMTPWQLYRYLASRTGKPGGVIRARHIRPPDRC